ncbi:MAG: CBS domain-containing protein [Prolixibacteraceae bacterium]|jgi:CBS domain-containing protein|nr:CBS domain-containing protein [Prolixibacteraceae bacterium]
MTSTVPFFLSRIIGAKVFDPERNFVGTVKDLLLSADLTTNQEPIERPVVHGISLKIKNQVNHFSFDNFEVSKKKRKLLVQCNKLEELPENKKEESIPLAALVLDKQIVDLNGRKVVRVNDVRLVTINSITYAIAVDVGIEGLLRRIGIAQPVKFLFSLVKASVPSKFISWDDMEAIDYSNLSIKLTSTYSKLNTLHPSDLADIIEDLDNRSRQSVFLALDEEMAADVLEEMEPKAQMKIIEGMSVEKMADVLEKMPANEAADILDELEEEKAELLLNEMEAESSSEVRELLEYENYEVGSIMTTEILAYREETTVEAVFEDLRVNQPEAESLFGFFVVNQNNELVATFSFRDLAVSQPEARISSFMNDDPIFLYDEQKMDDVAELVSKYNLLTIPVINKDRQLEGMVVIHDVIEDLVNKRRTNKK